MEQFAKCYGGVEEGVTNSVDLGGTLHKRDDICANILCAGKENVYSRLRKHYVQRKGGSRESDIFVVRTLDTHMCWWEGVADEARVMKGSEWLRVGHYPLGEGELQKSFYKEVNWSDLNLRVTC